MALKLETDSVEYQYLRDIKGGEEMEKRIKFLNSEGEDIEEEEDDEPEEEHSVEIHHEIIEEPEEDEEGADDIDLDDN